MRVCEHTASSACTGTPDHKHTDGPAEGGSKCAAAGSKVAGAPLGSCRFVSMDATTKPFFGYGSRMTLVAERFPPCRVKDFWVWGVGSGGRWNQ